MYVLGPSMPYLLRMYDFMIFLYVILSYLHLFVYLPLISHDNKPILFIYFPNAFEKIQQIKCMKSEF